MDLLGSWWRPGHDEEVGGRLVIDDNESTLDIFGTLADWSEHDFARGVTSDAQVPDIPMLNGFADGQQLTVLGLTCLSPRFPGMIGNEVWLCEAALETHLKEDHTLRFSGIKAELEHLGAWVGAPGASREWNMQDGSIRVEAQSEELVSVVLPDNTKLTLGQDLSESNEKEGIRLSFPASASFTGAALGSWRDLSEAYVMPLEALLWLATTRLSPADREWLKNDDERWTRYHASKIRPKATDVERQRRRLVPSEMLFTAADLPGGASQGLRQWFDDWDQMSHVLGPLIARDRSPFSYADDRFTAAVAAVEEYHRLLEGDDRELPRAEHRARVSKIVDLVDRHEPGYSDWVHRALREANRISLKARLVQLTEESGEVAQQMLGNHLDDFIDAVCDARNEYAHGTKKESKIKGGEILHWSAAALRWLLRVTLLRSMGFDDSVTRVSGYSRFSQEAKRIHDALSHSL